MPRLTDITTLCPPGITATGFGVLAIDLAAVIGVKGSEPGMVQVTLYGAPPERITAACADPQRNPAHELAAAIRDAANEAKETAPAGCRQIEEREAKNELPNDPRGPRPELLRTVPSDTDADACRLDRQR